MTKRRDDNLEADLSAYLDGELSAERAQEIEDLIARSDEVAGTLDELRAVSGELGTLPRRQAPSELMAVVVRQLEKQPPAGQSSSRRQPRVLRLFGQVAAAAAVLAACVYVSWQALDRPPSVAGVEMASQPERSQPASAEESAVDVLVARDTHKSVDVVPSAAAPPVVVTNEDVSVRRGLVQRSHAKGAEHLGGQILSAGAAGEPRDKAAAEETPFEVVASVPVNDSSAPEVSVLIAPTNVEEYRAASAVLARWQAENASRKHDVKKTVGENTYYFATADLSRRIEELDAGAPGHVRVQMSFLAADRNFLELAAGGQRDTLPQVGEAVVAYAAVTDENAGDTLERRREMSGAPERTHRARAAPDTAPARQPRPNRQPAVEEESIDEDDGPVDMFDMEALIRRAEAQHRAATAPLPVIVVIPTSSQPTTGSGPATRPTTMPTSQPADKPMPAVPTLLYSLSRLLLEGPPAPEPPKPHATASDEVRFRVILVPPPESQGVPSGATTQPDRP